MLIGSNLSLFSNQWATLFSFKNMFVPSNYSLVSFSRKKNGIPWKKVTIFRLSSIRQVLFLMTVYSLCNTQNIKLERWCVLRSQDSIKLVYLTASPRASFRESGFCLFTHESDEEYNKYKNTVWCHCLQLCQS